VISCQVGKLQKEIKLELDEHKVDSQIRIANLEELLKLEKNKVTTL
jgi:hypothetical protein